jgi:hypothetical protein
MYLVWFEFREWPGLTMFYTMVKTEFYYFYLLLMFDEIAIFFYHNLNFFN